MLRKKLEMKQVNVIISSSSPGIMQGFFFSLQLEFSRETARCMPNV